MATRMQQRRGTASQWTSANPVLNAGEIGWESDTNKFKIGDGTNHWADLDYFADSNSTVNPAFGSSIVFEGTTADSYETTLSVTDPTADRTIALPDGEGTVVLDILQQTLTNKTLTSPNISGLNITDGSIVIEGATPDGFETTLTAIDPTADRSIEIPDVSGKIITTGNLSDITTTGVLSAPLVFEGATANDFETTLAVTDPTADRTITLPDATGTVITTGNLSGITSLGTISSIVFEGSTSDDFELTLAGGDPTADRTVSFPDAGGIVVVDTAEQTLTNKTLTSPHVSNLTITDGSIILEGSSPDNFETTLTVTDPTADRTITFPDITGTVVTTGDTGTVTSTMIANGTIVDADINASAAIAQSKISGLTTDLGNKQDKVSGVSDTEIGYLDGVTSAIQTQLDAKLPKSGGTMTGDLTLAGAPSSDLHAATKAYVDAATIGLNVHASVKAATTTNVTLASDLENGDTLDGVTLATGNRILVKNQTDKTTNGIYTVNASGAPTRADDYNAVGEIDAGDFIFVESGTANGKTGWMQTNAITTLGSDDIEFTQFSGAGTYAAGTGLTLTGTTFSINTSTTVDVSTAQTLTNKTLTSAKLNLGINPQTGTSYEFDINDNGKFVTASNSSPITVTIPPVSSVPYPTGAQLNIIQKGTGQVTFAAGSGVTIYSTGATAAAPKTRVRYSSATAVHEGSDVWYVVGDIS